jgi:hypothetical protein
MLDRAPAWVRGVFEHDWAPMEALAHQVGCLPDALWGFLLCCEGGFAIISNDRSRYVPGPVEIRGQQVRNVAFIAVEDLARGNEQPLRVIGHLVDHYLGCGGDLEGPWLSEGGGMVPGWKGAGERLSRLFALGYGVDEVACSGVRNYFAQSLAVYCLDRRRLNVADPQMTKWLRHTLWDDGFWREWEQTKGDLCMNQD